MLFLFVAATLLVSSVFLTPLMATSFDHPGLLPSNPFYFFKQWSRDLKRTFTFSTLKKVELELEILDEKAAELGKLLELSPENSAVIDEAVLNYNKSAVGLIGHLDSMREQNIGFSNILFDKLVDCTSRHTRLFGYLSERNQKPNNIQPFLINEFGAVSAIYLNLQAVSLTDDFRGQLFSSLRLAEAVDEVERRVSLDKKHDLLLLKEALLKDFVAELPRRQVPEELMASLRGNLINRLRVLDEVRVGVENIDTKSQLSIIRQSVLEQIKKEQLFDRQQVELMIVEARELAQIQSSDEIDFYIKQTVGFLENDQINAAAGQASLAIAAMKNKFLDLEFQR